MRTRFADTAQHADTFFVIRTISSTRHTCTNDVQLSTIVMTSSTHTKKVAWPQSQGFLCLKNACNKWRTKQNDATKRITRGGRKRSPRLLCDFVIFW